MSRSPEEGAFMKKKNNLKGLEPLSAYPLKNSNSWKVGGPGEFFCQPENQEELFYFLAWAKERNLPITVLGKGTNVLISDEGVKGLVVCLTKLNSFQEWKEEGRLRIKAQAGLPKAQLMQIFLKRGLAPALFLCGLPGDLGGGLVMNAGVGQNIVPREFKDIVDWIKVINTESSALPVKIFKKEEIKWGYRASRGWRPGLIYEAGLSWPLQPLPDLSDRLREMAVRRSQSQPLQSASCGSVFKNPGSGEKAGALIEQCGLKGYRIGQACVSEKHANFIVNLGGALAMDIHKVIQYIQNTVHSQHGILLEAEVQYIGQWGDSGFPLPRE